MYDMINNYDSVCIIQVKLTEHHPGVKHDLDLTPAVIDSAPGTRNISGENS